jgi:hypothetical protein
MTKPLKLTDTQLILLSAASQRENLLLTPSDHLKGGAAKAVALALLAHSLVEEVRVGRDDPHWRMDDEDQPCGLRITAVGLEAIGVQGQDSVQATENAPLRADASPHGPQSAGESPHSTYEAGEPASGKPSALREGTKRALVVQLLSREQGASIDDLTTATGWLPHTTRAALTGLRQSGYAITRTRAEDNRTVYRLARPAEAASVQATPEPAEA